MDNPGVCFVCGCTEDDPCTFPGPLGRIIACGWANTEKTLCNNPECMEEAFACPVCGIPVQNHTPFMEAGCIMRELREVASIPFLIRS